MELFSTPVPTDSPSRPAAGRSEIARSPMPFKSEAQRKYMYAKHPKLAKEFESKTPKGKKLPKKAASKKGKK